MDRLADSDIEKTRGEEILLTVKPASLLAKSWS